MKVKLNKSKIEEFDEIINKPEYYFDFDKNPVIGRGFKGPRYEGGKVVKYTVVGQNYNEESEKQYKKHHKTTSKNEAIYSKKSTRAPGFDSSNTLFKSGTIYAKNDEKNDNYKVINHDQLDNIYKTFQVQKRTNSSKVIIT